jgi:Na+/H+ antiporter NhaD/arsenite permease-like protein
MSVPIVLGVVGTEIPPALLAPFVLLLLLIAVMPLTPQRARHAWEKYYPSVSVALAAAVAGYYLLNVTDGSAILGHTLHEYVSFISLIGSLFVVAGGIHVRVRGGATCVENVLFLAAGALLANVIGTTGASVVLIRPWLRMNQSRIHAYHVVFFIFIVSNVGGALTPIGDPPLFLGYLRGVPFFWLIEHVWAQWLVTLALILAVFYILDRRSSRGLVASPRSEVRSDDEAFRIEGGVNLLLLAIIVAAVFLPENYFVREMVMLGAAAVSLRVTPKAIHERNQFGFGPIKEVSFLFLGIFTTMMPALNLLETHGSRFGFTQPTQYFYATGSLSAVLDNAPTYVNFLKLAETSFVEETDGRVAGGGDGSRRAVEILVQRHPAIVVAISLGAVFFGAVTYIGNGPNFMVRSIAQSAGVACPSFFGYILRYSVPVLLPIFAFTAWLFL